MKGLTDNLRAIAHFLDRDEFAEVEEWPFVEVDDTLQQISWWDETKANKLIVIDLGLGVYWVRDVGNFVFEGGSYDLPAPLLEALEGLKG